MPTVRHLLRSFAAALLATWLAGCVLPAMNTAGIDDPPWLSPYARPLNTPAPVQAGRAETPPETRLRVPTSDPDLGEPSKEPSPDGSPRTELEVDDLPPQPNPDADEPSLSRSPRREEPPEEERPANPAHEPSPPPRGPALPELRRHSGLELSVRAPAVATVGEDVTLEIELRNDESEAHDGVRIECEFDESFVFSQKAEKRVARDFDRLEPGASRSFRLTLTAVDAGRHCCRFSLRDDGDEVSWKSVCVEVTERAVGLRAIGPARREVGARAEFTFQAVNLTQQPLTNLTLTVSSEAALRRFDWSAEATEKPGELQWTLGTLQPGEGAQVQVEFDCLVASEESCVTAVLRSNGKELRSTTGCLTIAAADEAMSMDLSDSRDPVRVDESTEFTLTVKNTGLQPLRDIVIEFDLPAQWKAGEPRATVDRKPATMATGATAPLTLDFRQPLPPDATLTIVLPAKATSNGEGVSRVTIRAAGLAARTIEEPTTVNP